jgi:hypothetical protein
MQDLFGPCLKGKIRSAAHRRNLEQWKAPGFGDPGAFLFMRYSMTRRCYKCNHEKDLIDFKVSKHEKYGRAYICRDCHYNSKNKSRNEKRAECYDYIEEYKRSHPCIVCGEDDPVVLDCHHRNPDEKDDFIRNIVEKTLSLHKVKIELTKCDILCANDHRRLHHKIKMAKRATGAAAF